MEINLIDYTVAPNAGTTVGQGGGVLVGIV